jgi:hypothetical protein
MPAIALLPRISLRETALDDALARYDANLAAYRILSAKMRHPNRTALFDALSVTRISLVIVTVDRDDGNGLIEHLALIADDRSARLPLGPITLSIPQWGLPDPLPLQLTIPHAIERMAYDCLEENFGSYPCDFTDRETLIFDVINRAVSITKVAKPINSIGNDD